MNSYDPLGVLIVGIATAIALILITGRVLLPALAERSRGAVVNNLDAYEISLDWAVHFSVGFLFLSIFTLYAVSAFEVASSYSGIFGGIAAACIAYVISRPPIRIMARNPELDGRLFALSVTVHLLSGIALAKLLIANSGP